MKNRHPFLEKMDCWGWRVALIIFGVMVAIGVPVGSYCIGLSRVSTDTPPENTKSVMTNAVDDDGKSTIYIRADNPRCGYEEETLHWLRETKRQWESENPTKKVVSISLVYADKSNTTKPSPTIIGLLVQYEQKQ